MLKVRRRIWTTLAAGSTLVLLACGGEETESAETPTPSTTAEDAADDAPAEDTATSTPTEEAAATSAAPVASPTADAGAAAGSTELTGPGEELALGDAAVLQVATVADPDDDYYRYAKLRTTVIEVVEADPGILDGVELATPIEDEVPYLVRAEHEIIETDGAYEKLDLYPELGAVHEDGSAASTIWADGADIGECTNQPFERLEPGSTASTCVIALGEGLEVVGATWSGNDNADGGGDWQANPYGDAPVVWGP